MKQFDVSVCREAWSTKTIRVDASTEAAARKLAVELAGDEVFTESGADYSVDSVCQVSPKQKYRLLGRSETVQVGDVCRDMDEPAGKYEPGYASVGDIVERSFSGHYNVYRPVRHKPKTKPKPKK